MSYIVKENTKLRVKSWYGGEFKETQKKYCEMRIQTLADNDVLNRTLKVELKDNLEKHARFKIGISSAGIEIEIVEPELCLENTVIYVRRGGRTVKTVHGWRSLEAYLIGVASWFHRDFVDMTGLRFSEVKTNLSTCNGVTEFKFGEPDETITVTVHQFPDKIDTGDK